MISAIDSRARFDVAVCAAEARTRPRAAATTGAADANSPAIERPRAGYPGPQRESA